MDSLAEKCCKTSSATGAPTTNNGQWVSRSLIMILVATETASSFPANAGSVPAFDTTIGMIILGVLVVAADFLQQLVVILNRNSTVREMSLERELEAARQSNQLLLLALSRMDREK